MRSALITMSQSQIGQRKTDHLDLCATDEVAFRGQTNLLEAVRLVHQSLPDLHLDQIDLSTELLGHKLKAPIVIAAMTGGTDRAGSINRQLAEIAQRRGYALGLGSQRAMQKDAAAASSFQVRDVAPDVPLFGNLGVVQARETTTAGIEELITAVGADAICLHMNPAMELIQPEGDRDFRGGTDTIRRCVEELSVPVIAKETGNGISRETAEKLFEAGVRWVDVSGAGGTSWVGVETLRAEGEKRALGELLWDWGVPTAASVVYAREAGLQPIATGGVRNGLDIVRALALGARAGGIARGVFQALESGGPEGADAYLDTIESQIRAAMLLVGAGQTQALETVSKLIDPALQRWIDAGG